MKKGMILVAKKKASNLYKMAFTIQKEYEVIRVIERFKQVLIIDDFGKKCNIHFDLVSDYFDIPETDPFQEFFSFMHQEHGLILTNGQMWDILNEIEKLQEKLKL
jgi:hypothetical protein